MVKDIITFNGEKDLLKLRLAILDPFVDEFIIVEAPRTFSGLKKPLYFKREDFPSEKITYHVIDERNAEEQYGQLADESPNVPVNGPTHWRREFIQKEAIKDALTHCQDNDVCFVGDVDEIWSEEALLCNLDRKLKLKVYTYYLNNRSSEEFWGTIKTDYKTIKEGCLNHLRTFLPKTDMEFGWHFTSMGGYNEMFRKLIHSYTSDSYSNEAVMVQLRQNMTDNKDFLGRSFKYKSDESEWPPYLTEHRKEYEHLCSPKTLS